MVKQIQFLKSKITRPLKDVVKENIFSGDVEYVGVKSADGELGILSKHVPLITELVEGKVTWRVNNKNEEVNISGGFLEVVNNKVTILVDRIN